MTDYFDNNKKWEWKVTDDEAIIEVDHGDHTHQLDLSQIPAEDLNNNPNQYLGDAHRASEHYYKDKEEQEDKEEKEQEDEEENSVSL